MAATDIGLRKWQMPTWTLRISGSAVSEPEMAELMTELDPAVYVLDPLWNMSPDMVRDKIPPFVHILRAVHPMTPILLVEGCTIRGIIPTEMGKVLRDVYANLQEEGVPEVYFLSAEGMLGPDDEGTVDGVHPTDLGFMYQAEAFVKALRPILGLH